MTVSSPGWRALRLVAVVMAASSASMALVGCTQSDSRVSGTGSSTADRTPAAAPVPPPTTLAPTPTPTPPGASPDGHRVDVSVLRWRLPEPLAREAAASGPHGVLVAGGMLADESSTGAAYELSLDGGASKRVAPLPIAVHDVAGVHSRAGFLVLGGGNSTEQAAVQSLGTTGHWVADAPLPTPRSDLAAVAVGNRVFVIGGYSGLTPALPSVLVKADGSRWAVFGQLPVPVRYPAVAMSGGAIWVIGGERNGAMVTAIQRIDMTTGRIRVAAHLTSALGHAAAVAFGRRILIVGGRTAQDQLTRSLWWFEPGTGALSRAGRLPLPLADSALVADGGSAYLLGGETPAVTAQVLRITPRP